MGASLQTCFKGWRRQKIEFPSRSRASKENSPETFKAPGVQTVKSFWGGAADLSLIDSGCGSSGPVSVFTECIMCRLSPPRVMHSMSFSIFFFFLFSWTFQLFILFLSFKRGDGEQVL